MRLLQAELSLSHYTRDLWDVLESEAEFLEDLDNSKMGTTKEGQDSLGRVSGGMKFVPNLELASLLKSDLGAL